ncbi:IS3 family transposase [Gilvimarinus agarilyticus]|nr:IS3 family transposase [Gilvimarinus agarilyticus]
MKSELIGNVRFQSFRDLHRALKRYINNFYNTVSLQSWSKYSPIEY